MKDAHFSLGETVFIVDADSDCKYQVWGPVTINEVVVTYRCTRPYKHIKYGFYQSGICFSASHCGKEAKDIFRRDCDAKRSASLRNRNVMKRLSSLRG